MAYSLFTLLLLIDEWVIVFSQAGTGVSEDIQSSEANWYWVRQIQGFTFVLLADVKLLEIGKVVLYYTFYVSCIRVHTDAIFGTCVSVWTENITAKFHSKNSKWLLKNLQNTTGGYFFVPQPVDLRGWSIGICAQSWRPAWKVFAPSVAVAITLCCFTCVCSWWALVLGFWTASIPTRTTLCVPASCIPVLIRSAVWCDSSQTNKFRLVVGYVDAFMLTGFCSDFCRTCVLEVFSV